MTTTFYGAREAGPSSAVFGLLLRLLSSNWTWGRLTLVLPDGTSRQLSGKESGHAAVMNIRSYNFAARVLKGGDIGFAEAYMAGEWDSPQLAVLLETLVNNYDHIRRLFDGNRLVNAINWLGHRLNRNSRRGSRRNIHAHYDLGNAFYASWLDPSMTYSSARFERPGLSLQEAQRAKYASLARMMDLQPGQRVLEMGCGWGALAEMAAGEFQAQVTGVTLSTEQLAWGQQRMQAAGVAPQVDLRLQDYRDIQDAPFDAICSIEMVEAVGQAYWPSYFGTVARLLKPGGRACVQSIVIDDALFERYVQGTDFIQQYVFPGGCLPSPARFRAAAQQAGLRVVEELAFGSDYAETLRRWHRQFTQQHAQVLAQGFDAKFLRTWEFYLAYCEAAFDSGSIDVVQYTLVKN